jgi:hypothetical protein
MQKSWNFRRKMATSGEAKFARKIGIEARNVGGE